MNFLNVEILDISNENYIGEIGFWTHFSGEIKLVMIFLTCLQNHSKIHVDQIKGLKLRAT
jgi:hypothetical protein